MNGMIKFAGMTVGSSLGGWLGGMVGMGTMIVLSAVGAGLGFYAADRLMRMLSE